MCDYEDENDSPDPDAYLYGTYDAMQGFTPDPEERGFFDKDADAYNWAYNVESSSHSKPVEG